jgi:hypothetical protein
MGSRSRFSPAPRADEKGRKIGDAKEQASLPPTAGPACSWSHLSWTHLEKEQVTEKVTASDGRGEKREEKVTVELHPTE